MAENTCEDYSKYLQQINYKKEIEPISTNIDEIAMRMEEFESSLIIIKNLSSLTSLPEIIQCADDFQKHFDKIDKLQVMLNSMNQALTALEGNVTMSENTLGFNNTGLKAFLKPWFGLSSGSATISKKDGSRTEEGSSEHLSYHHELRFKADDYFCAAANDIEESEA